MHSVVALTKCPGLFCGRVEPNSSLCSACPWGSLADNDSLCRPCDTPPTLHDCFFLGFVCSIPAVLFLVEWGNSLPVSPVSRPPNRLRYVSSLDPLLLLLDRTRQPALPQEETCALSPTADSPVKTAASTRFCSYQPAVVPVACVLLHLCAILITVLLFPPLGSFSLSTCPPRVVEDFYAIFLAASGCFSETAFPYLSLPLVYYLVSASLSALVYCLVATWCGIPGHHLKVVCYTLYAYPLLAVGHVLLAGPLYFTFEFLLLVVVLLYSAYRFPQLFDYAVDRLDTTGGGSQSPPPLLPARDLATSLRYVGHARRHRLVCVSVLLITATVAYAIVSFSREAVHHYWGLAFCVAPVLFYLVTLPFTHPLVYFDWREVMETTTLLLRTTADRPHDDPPAEEAPESGSLCDQMTHLCDQANRESEHNSNQDQHSDRNSNW